MIAYFSGRFSNIPPYQKLIFLGFTILFSMLMINLVWLLFVIIFFGQDMFNAMGSFENVTDPATIKFMKINQAINQLGVFVVPSILYSVIVATPRSDFLKIYKRPAPVHAFLAVISILAFIPVLMFLLRLNEHLSLPAFAKSIENWMVQSEVKANRLTETFLNVVSWGGLAGNLAVIGLFASVGEEFLFRGVILNLVKEWTGRIHLSVFLSAFIFSALHLQFFGFLPRFAIGLLFGYVFIWTANLWIPVIMHFIFNSFTVIWAYLYSVKQISTPVSEMESYSNITAIILSLVTGSIVVFYLHRYVKKPG